MPVNQYYYRVCHKGRHGSQVSVQNICSALCTYNFNSLFIKKMANEWYLLLLQLMFFSYIGMFVNADRCCREHDHCEHIIRSFSVNFGVFNPTLFTLSHCDCDDRWGPSFTFLRWEAFSGPQGRLFKVITHSFVVTHLFCLITLCITTRFKKSRIYFAHISVGQNDIYV